MVRDEMTNQIFDSGVAIKFCDLFGKVNKKRSRPNKRCANSAPIDVCYRVLPCVLPANPGSGLHKFGSVI